MISFHKQLAFLANKYAGYDIFFRVATTNTDGGQSDFKCVKTHLYIGKLLLCITKADIVMHSLNTTVDDW